MRILFIWVLAIQTTHQRAQAYLTIATSLLEEDKLKEIRKTLIGKQHYTSDRFQEQIREKLALKQKRPRGRPRKINN